MEPASLLARYSTIAADHDYTLLEGQPLSQLLSVSIDMCKMVRELVATKCVVVVSLETSSAPPSDLWLEYEEFIVRDDKGHVAQRPPFLCVHWTGHSMIACM